ncbi:MAG: DUF262 domain-containing protein [Deltaproteobacteria bacterium]|uniref:DUF262 domain-containing protein n=1 Tax=Candidatus Zymogenus saltonus TaxID=2844893 RepID=A0A9D8KDZ5_9DELT|nr:DUF262 domain-containing protein [Candidatus Zymogenus saltonus]
MKFLDANEITILQLLADNSKAYSVPIYQRPYVWNDEQWQELFDDLTNLSPNDVHFLGSMVVVPDSRQDLNINYFQIVDGQQRMATILIWLSALRDIFLEKGSNRVSDFIANYFFIDLMHEEDFDKVPKLRLGHHDNDIFRRILEGEPVPDSDKLLDKCYAFFKEETIKYSKPEEIYTKLLNKISVVHINVFSHLNAFRLFETLNDRGLELSSVDLIKNFILMKVSGERDIFDKTIVMWNDMYEKVREIEPVSFLRRSILSEYRGKVSETRVYEKIRQLLESEEPKAVSDFAAWLNEKAAVYKKIVDANFESSVINALLVNLKQIKVAPCYPLLMKVFTRYNAEGKEIPEEDIIGILNDTESFFIRWGVCRRYSGNLDRFFNNLTVELSEKKPSEYRNYIREALKREMAENGVDEEAFRERFISSPFNPNDSRTKYILFKLSNPGEFKKPADLKDVQTEHIMPKRLTNGWRSALSNSGKGDEEVSMLHREYLNRIGNLTPIRGDWYLKYSSKPFNEKKMERHYKECEFSITRVLNERYDKGSWTFKTIEERSRELFDIVEENGLWRI